MRFIVDNLKVNKGPGAPTVQVLGAGLPRCATSSFQAALESPVIGFSPCMHMDHVAPHASRMQLVIDALGEMDREKRHKLLYKLFDGYAATVDFPGAAFMDDLMDMYPDAPIVLNQRSSGEEYETSIKSTIGFFGTWTFLVTCCLWKTDRQLFRVLQVWSAAMKRKTGEGDIMTARAYHLHNQWVRDEAAKRGRPVLEFQAKDGYPALCKFLGKPVPPPETEFPHLNDTATMKLLQRILMVRGVLSWATLIGTVAGVWKYGPYLARLALSYAQK